MHNVSSLTSLGKAEYTWTRFSLIWQNFKQLNSDVLQYNQNTIKREKLTYILSKKQVPSFINFKYSVSLPSICSNTHVMLVYPICLPYFYTFTLTRVVGPHICTASIVMHLLMAMLLYSVPVPSLYSNTGSNIEQTLTHVHVAEF